MNFVFVFQGGPKEGAELLHHPEVAKWFMTGDVKTANRILFDMTESPFKDREPGTVSFEEMEAKLILKKPFTIELGNCSPFIIAPGEWTDRELYRHARVRIILLSDSNATLMCRKCVYMHEMCYVHEMC